MERHDSMTRTARYLLGAGMMAAAMVATTGGSASAQEPPFECLPSGEGDATVCGHVYTDTSTDGYTTGEGVSNVFVVIKEGDVPVGNSPIPTVDCNNDGSDYCGYFGFVVPPGTYSVCLVTEGSTTCLNTPVEVTVAETDTQDHRVDIPLESGDEEIPTDNDSSSPFGSGTGTPGYWKNHPDDWPAEGVTVGGVLYQGESIKVALTYMGKVGGNKTYTMFASLISAKLNTMLSLGNNYECIAGTLYWADKWMTDHPVDGPVVKASSEYWEVGEPLHQKLDDYNNGKLCAPHRD